MLLSRENAQNVGIHILKLWLANNQPSGTVHLTSPKLSYLPADPPEFKAPRS